MLVIGFTRHLFDTNSFAGSVALAEEKCTLLSVILVVIFSLKSSFFSINKNIAELSNSIEHQVSPQCHQLFVNEFFDENYRLCFVICHRCW